MTVRIESITIKDFKNVSFGALDLIKKNSLFQSNILGLYGQNGSGKTALINSLSMLKYILCGVSLPHFFGDYINVDCDSSHFEYKFSIGTNDEDEIIHLVYSFDIFKEKEVANGTIESVNEKTVITNEKLSYYATDDGIITEKSTVILDTSKSKTPFGPSAQYEKLAGKSREVLTDLLVLKKYTRAMSRSFAFSAELADVINRNCKDEKIKNIFNTVLNYGRYQLYVIDLINSSNIDLNIVTRKGDGLTRIKIPFEGNGLVPVEEIDTVRSVIRNMNIVLKQLIPGLAVDIKELGRELTPDSKTACRIQLLSLKNGKSIPLCYESEGIKKIIAILQLLILAYNDYSVTVAIDELDSGIFEYLLGELLRIMAASGKGQLIFTSHNLRPLETIDISYIAFTTTDPAKRYMRLSNVKKNNNLRSLYYRDICLGDGPENMYEPTSNVEIAMAFREAGENRGQ